MQGCKSNRPSHGMAWMAVLSFQLSSARLTTSSSSTGDTRHRVSCENVAWRCDWLRPWLERHIESFPRTVQVETASRPDLRFCQCATMFQESYPTPSLDKFVPKGPAHATYVRKYLQLDAIKIHFGLIKKWTFLGDPSCGQRSTFNKYWWNLYFTHDSQSPIGGEDHHFAFTFPQNSSSPNLAETFARGRARRSRSQVGSFHMQDTVGLGETLGYVNLHGMTFWETFRNPSDWWLWSGFPVDFLINQSCDK